MPEKKLIPGLAFPPPLNMLEQHLDKNQYPHNENGPALTNTKGQSYYYTHGIQWDDEKYNQFIIKKVLTIDPDFDPTEYPFTRLEQIVIKVFNYGERTIYGIKIPPSFTAAPNVNTTTIISPSTLLPYSNSNKWNPNDYNPTKHIKSLPTIK